MKYTLSVSLLINFSFTLIIDNEMFAEHEEMRSRNDEMDI
jgi:hypothetical protein